MWEQIVVTTGSRLHFGFFSHRSTPPPPRDSEKGTSLRARNYGGVGLMIDSPGFIIAASRSDRDRIDCSAAQNDERGTSQAERDSPVRSVTEALMRYRKSCPSQHEPPPCRIEVRGVIPRHQGLGSGTQLGMAVAQALALLAGEGLTGVATLAARVWRGRRSAVGIHGFGRGGFLVESGKTHEDEISPLVARVEVPAKWRFLLVTPTGAAAREGLSGSAEIQALQNLPDTSAGLTDRLSRLALLEMLPALAQVDVERFSEAMYEFGRTVGEYFRPVQGGDFASPQMASLVEWLRAEGQTGVAQTSWGPTIAICCGCAESAEALHDRIRDDSRWQDCSLRTVSPLNTGATIEFSTGSRKDW